MNVLITKLGATGDVVRTTPILGKLHGRVTWLTAAKNISLIRGIQEDVSAVAWDDREMIAGAKYDLIINLEDTLEVGVFVKTLRTERLFGAFLNGDNSLCYTADSEQWFDLSLISKYGLQEADKLKLRNRRSYQDLIFEGFGLSFNGERYLLPKAIETGLKGDVAISPTAGPVWPMKNWAYYGELQRELESQGFTVNVLGKRPTLLEHLADVRNHRCLVGGDSLPMHLALGSGTPCVTLFTCTSPWEIHDYGVQQKIISPLLEEFFYKRGFDERATTAISVDEVLTAVLGQLEAAVAVANERTPS